MSKEEPEEFVAPQHWSEDQMAHWQAQTLAAIKMCAELMPNFTTKAVWWLIDSPPERRAMLVAVNRAVKLGYIARVGTVPAYTDVYESRDGHKWKQNKVVPNLRSLIF